MNKDEKSKLTTENSPLCFGIQSNLPDGKHIFMLDYDGDDYSLLYKSIIDIQNTYKLSDFFILKSANGYNAFTLDKLELDFIVSILSNYDIIDPQFIALAMHPNRGFFVLRMGQEKRYCSYIPSSFDLHEKSYAHYLFFKDIMKFPVTCFGEHDKNKQFQIIAYRSGKHGWGKIQL